MSRSLATSLALSAAALYLGACGKQPTPTTNPDAATAVDGTDDASSEATDEVAAVEVKCLGINDCAGQSLCDVAGSHDCGGQNECKGKGWILVSEAECETKGGEVVAAEAAEEPAVEPAADEPA